MRLGLDHHYSTKIAVELRQRGHDAVAAIERGWESIDDDALLEVCAAEGRALLTNNVAELVVIARRWATQGRPHGGLIFTSDSSMPRSRATIGRYVEALDELLRANPGDDAFTDRSYWLTDRAVSPARSRRRQPPR